MESKNDSTAEKNGVKTEIGVSANVCNTDFAPPLSFNSKQFFTANNESNGKQAGTFEDLPACLPSTPDPGPTPKLAGLRNLFPDDFMPSDSLHALDAHFVLHLGPDYDRQSYVDFVKRRQDKGIRKSGKIRTGLVFEYQTGLPHDFIEWYKGQAETNRLEAEDEERRQRQAEEARELAETTHVLRVLTNPFSPPADIAEAKAHPAGAHFQPDPAMVQIAFDNEVTVALDGLNRGCAAEWMDNYNDVLRRAAELDPDRLKELRARRQFRAKG